MTRRSLPTAHLLAAATLAAGLTLTVAGCATRESGAAAVVGDRRITVAQVQDAYQDIQPLVGQDQALQQSTILNLLILEPYLTRAAAGLGRGVSVTDAELDIKAAASGKNVTMSPSGLEVWQANLASQALQNSRQPAQINDSYKRIAAEVKADGVHINPRYGAGIDFTDLTVTPAMSNWLKSTAAPSTAAPAEQQPTEQPTATATDQPTDGATPTP